MLNSPLHPEPGKPPAPSDYEVEKEGELFMAAMGQMKKGGA